MWSNSEKLIQTTAHRFRPFRQTNFASTPEETRRGELGQPSIFCSDDDATNSAFKAAQSGRLELLWERFWRVASVSAAGSAGGRDRVEEHPYVLNYDAMGFGVSIGSGPAPDIPRTENGKERRSRRQRLTFLLSGHSFPVPPKVLPDNSHREFRQKAP